jgi:hypothetical protein
MNDPMRADTTPSTSTPGRSEMRRNATTCRTSTMTAVRMSENGATIASMTGRTMTLNSAMRTIAMTASSGRPMVTPGRSQAVASRATVDTMSVTSRRRARASGPPRHCHRIRNWVA